MLGKCLSYAHRNLQSLYNIKKKIDPLLIEWNKAALFVFYVLMAWGLAVSISTRSSYSLFAKCATINEKRTLAYQKQQQTCLQKKFWIKKKLKHNTSIVFSYKNIYTALRN